MKWPSEILQDLPYFYNMKAHAVFFSFFISCNFIFFPNEWPGLCWHRPGLSLVKKNKVVRNEKQKLHEFSYDKNVTNFEGFR